MSLIAGFETFEEATLCMNYCEEHATDKKELYFNVEELDTLNEYRHKYVISIFELVDCGEDEDCDEIEGYLSSDGKFLTFKDFGYYPDLKRTWSPVFNDKYLPNKFELMAGV